MRDRLTELGANVFVQPAVSIGPPRDWAAVDAALARLDRCDWLVFSSGNGVRWFLDRLLAGGGDLRRLGGVKLAAIGPGTAAELANYRLKADLVPAEYRAESLAEALLPPARRAGVSPPAPTAAARSCPNGWLAAGADGRSGCSLLERWRSPRPTRRSPPRWRKAASTGRRRPVRRSPDRWPPCSADALHRVRLASISPITSAVLGEVGYAAGGRSERIHDGRRGRGDSRGPTASPPYANSIVIVVAAMVVIGART